MPNSSAEKSGQSSLRWSLKRQIRAAIHNLSKGKPLHAGETPATIAGYAAYVYMTDPVLGAKLLKQLAAIEG